MSLSAADIIRIKAKITNVLQAHAGVAPSTTAGLLPIKGLQGKLYEADVLANICENLHVQENLRISLVSGTYLMFKQKGGPINRSFPYFEVKDVNGVLLFELFTDIYFKTVSYHENGGGGNPRYGDYHELDIALLIRGCSGIPDFKSVVLAAECKNTSIKKSIIREMLGFRRELSFYNRTLNSTAFNAWPVSQVYANPASVHMLYCSCSKVTRYTRNCERFGIIIKHHVM